MNRRRPALWPVIMWPLQRRPAAARGGSGDGYATVCGLNRCNIRRTMCDDDTLILVLRDGMLLWCEELVNWAGNVYYVMCPLSFAALWELMNLEVASYVMHHSDESDVILRR